jgi:hypothetical protein
MPKTLIWALSYLASAIARAQICRRVSNNHNGKSVTRIVRSYQVLLKLRDCRAPPVYRFPPVILWLQTFSLLSSILQEETTFQVSRLQIRNSRFLDLDWNEQKTEDRTTVK